MTDKLSYLYLKIITFEETLETFKDYYKLYCNEAPSPSQFHKCFWQLRLVLIRYCKYFRSYYKHQNMIIYFPAQVLRQAKKDGLINDADTWLEYINDLHICLNQPKQERLEYMKQIMNKYATKVDSMLEFIHSPQNNRFISNNKELYESVLSSNIELPDSPPIYSHKELLITEHSYNVLIDYFKSEPAIKTVWLHGSRVCGTSNPYSDLDLIIDCDMEQSKNISKNIHKLLIPYYLDITYLHDDKKNRMLKFASYYGAKKIYHSTDFQIYWSTSNHTKQQSLNFNINKIIT